MLYYIGKKGNWGKFDTGSIPLYGGRSNCVDLGMGNGQYLPAYANTSNYRYPPCGYPLVNIVK